MAPSTGTVLIATASGATEYAAWLDEEWTVQTVADTDELVATATPDLAVVVLGRELGDGAPEHVLDELRAAGVDRPVVVVTDEATGGDSVGSRFSAELVRPLDEPTIAETVATMAARSDETVQKQEYLALAASQAAMEIELSPAEASDDEAYNTLMERIEQLRSRAEVPLTELEDEFAESLT